MIIQENVAKLPDGLLFVADKQFGGKGGCSQASRAAVPASFCGRADDALALDLLPRQDWRSCWARG